MNSDLLQRLFSLEGKTVLVTGGYSGIGRTFAETYAELGANLALVARNADKVRAAAAEMGEKYGTRVVARAADVNDAAAIDSLVAEVAAEFGRIDVLVNSAGIADSGKPLVETGDAEFDRVMGVNLRGVFIVSRAVAREMIKQQSGRIINVSSLAAKRAISNMSAYCTSKAAVVHLTRVLARELMRYNIQVNALCPGYFLTAMNREFFTSETGRKVIEKTMPMRRLGELGELQSSAVYLATCPPFLTGADLYIDGGQGL
jgi:gluconate 5-dehydrogenase